MKQHTFGIRGIAMLVAVWLIVAAPASSARAESAAKAPEGFDPEQLTEITRVVRQVAELMDDPETAGLLAVLRVKDLAARHDRAKEGAEVLVRIARETKHSMVRRSALLTASELFEKAGDAGGTVEALVAVCKDAQPPKPPVRRAARAQSPGPATRAEGPPPRPAAGPEAMQAQLAQLAKTHPLLARLIRMRLARRFGGGREPGPQPRRTEEAERKERAQRERAERREMEQREKSEREVQEFRRHAEEVKSDHQRELHARAAELEQAQERLDDRERELEQRKNELDARAAELDALEAKSKARAKGREAPGRRPRGRRTGSRRAGERDRRGRAGSERTEKARKE